MVAETERLRLRRLEPDDAEFLHELTSEDSYREFLASQTQPNVAATRERLQRAYLAAYERDGFGFYLVELLSTGEAIGICGLANRGSLDGVDIGYGFLKRHWSKGYALEASRAVVAHARTDLGLKRLIAMTHPDNQASLRLIEKLGMTLEGLAPAKDGETPDLLFGLDL